MTWHLMAARNLEESIIGLLVLVSLIMLVIWLVQEGKKKREKELQEQRFKHEKEMAELKARSDENEKGNA